MKNLILSEYEKRFKSLSDTVSKKSGELKEIDLELLDKYEQKFKSLAESARELKDVEFKLREFKNRKESDTFFVEKNYKGIRSLIHRRGNEVKVFSNKGEEVTELFTGMLEEIKALSECNFVLDCEAVKTKTGLVLYATDLLYLDNDVTDLPLHKRKNLMKQLSFTERIKESPAVVARNQEEMRKAIELFNKLDEEKGVVIKRFNGEYIPRESGDWIEFVAGEENGKRNTAG